MHINKRVLFKILGTLTFIEGIFMVPCAIIGIYYQESIAVKTFLIASAICIAIGLTILTRFSANKISLRTHEGYIIACSSWVFCSILGAIPFYFCGQDYSLIGSFFESAAGFSTTGCTVFNIDTMPKSIILWKSISNWLGGMGILVLVVSAFPSLGISGQSIAFAETSGNSAEKVGAKYVQTGKILYITYLIFTLAEFVLLLASPLTMFDALVNTLSSVSTAGLLIRSETAHIFSNVYVRGVILIFTFLSSLNYLVFYFCIKGKWKTVFENIELKAFSFTILLSTGLIALSLKLTGTYSSLWQAVKDSLCQVVSFASTSGYYVCNYTNWPTFCIIILFLLMLIGGCTMSTSGSLKVLRAVVLTKLVHRGIFKQIHPHSVKAVMINKKHIPAERVSAIATHAILYFFIIFAATLLLSLNNLDLETTFTTVIGLFSNTGMALGATGYTGYFGMFNGFSQMLLAFVMICGRLEIYSVLILFSTSFWRQDKVKTI